MTKRKASRKDAPKSKKVKHSPPTPLIYRELLSFHYHNCTSLRAYVLASLPSTSRLRRRKIESIGKKSDCSGIEKELARLLDTTLVCFHQLTPDSSDNRWQQWQSFSQKDDSTVTLNGKNHIFSQSEIVDFVIWLSFSRDDRPRNLLCSGYQRYATEENQSEIIPGLYIQFSNDQVTTIKQSPWPQLLALLGQSGEKIMLNLLVDCSIFATLGVGMNNFYQLSGDSISELGPRTEVKTPNSQEYHKLSEIVFMKSRMLYVRSQSTSKGSVKLGLGHMHILNQRPYKYDAKAQAENARKNDVNTATVMMHMFPRQFGLQNVFVSTLDDKSNRQKFLDYTNRDEEIESHLRSDGKFQQHGIPSIPKRLYGAGRDLVRKLQIRHSRCSYFELIRHYCPSLLDSPNAASQRSKSLGLQLGGKKAHSSKNKGLAKKSLLLQLDSSTPIVDLATPRSHVSAFLQAALFKVVPAAFWGEGEDLIHNKSLLKNKIHHLIGLRRYESFNLHELSQGFKLSSIAWLRLSSQNGRKPCQQETNKRLEIFHEFLYYVFDSFLMSLAGQTFYITESSSHRQQMFYFRQDMWKIISDREMSVIKDGMLKEICVGDLKRCEYSKQLGFCQIRLVPKGASLRPIMNLKRRQLINRGKNSNGLSTNRILKPVHRVLKYEKDLNPSNLGATLFCVGDIYTKLKEFKSKLPTPIPQLYFVKADVRSAFDTIPQDAILELIMAKFSHQEYKVLKHAEVKAKTQQFEKRTKPGENPPADELPPKPYRRWNEVAYPSNQRGRFPQRIEADTAGIAAAKRKNTIFVNKATTAARSHHTVEQLTRLLEEHIADNHIKVGKKTYRQKRGIPQGSVLSTLLCNYFYADLEAKHLAFLGGGGGGAGQSLLMRLIDDFLLVTTDRDRARRFAEVLHGGVPEYGVRVRVEKSLANFAVEVKTGGEEGVPVSVKLARVAGDDRFPYCGIYINCRTLEMSKNHDREVNIASTLTVSHGHLPGRNFESKMLNLFIRQCDAMFFDTNHNSARTVMASIRETFWQLALKMWAYVRCLDRSCRPRGDLICRAIAKIIQVSYTLLTGRFRRMKMGGYECKVRRRHVFRIAFEAFEQVLSTKQTQYRQVLTWLRLEIAKC